MVIGGVIDPDLSLYPAAALALALVTGVPRRAVGWLGVPHQHPNPTKGGTLNSLRSPQFSPKTLKAESPNSVKNPKSEVCT